MLMAREKRPGHLARIKLQKLKKKHDLNAAKIADAIAAVKRLSAKEFMKNEITKAIDKALQEKDEKPAPLIAEEAEEPGPVDEDAEETARTETVEE